MSKIVKILHSERRGEPSKDEYMLVNVLMQDGTEAVVFCGGDCEVYFAHGRINAFVKRDPTKETK